MPRTVYVGDRRALALEPLYPWAPRAVPDGFLHGKLRTGPEGQAASLLSAVYSAMVGPSAAQIVQRTVLPQKVLEMVYSDQRASAQGRMEEALKEFMRLLPCQDPGYAAALEAASPKDRPEEDTGWGGRWWRPVQMKRLHGEHFLSAVGRRPRCARGRPLPPVTDEDQFAKDSAEIERYLEYSAARELLAKGMAPAQVSGVTRKYLESAARRYAEDAAVSAILLSMLRHRVVDDGARWYVNIPPSVSLESRISLLERRMLGEKEQDVKDADARYARRLVNLQTLVLEEYAKHVASSGEQDLPESILEDMKAVPLSKRQTLRRVAWENYIRGLMPQGVVAEIDSKMDSFLEADSRREAEYPQLARERAVENRAARFENWLAGLYPEAEARVSQGDAAQFERWARTVIGRARDSVAAASDPAERKRLAEMARRAMERLSETPGGGAAAGVFEDAEDEMRRAESSSQPTADQDRVELMFDQLLQELGQDGEQKKVLSNLRVLSADFAGDELQDVLEQAALSYEADPAGSRDHVRDVVRYARHVYLFVRDLVRKAETELGSREESILRFMRQKKAVTESLRDEAPVAPANGPERRGLSVLGTRVVVDEGLVYPNLDSYLASAALSDPYAGLDRRTVYPFLLREEHRPNYASALWEALQRGETPPWTWESLGLDAKLLAADPEMYFVSERDLDGLRELLGAARRIKLSGLVRDGYRMLSGRGADVRNALLRLGSVQDREVVFDDIDPVLGRTSPGVGENLLGKTLGVLSEVMYRSAVALESQKRLFSEKETRLTEEVFLSQELCSGEPAGCAAVVPTFVERRATREAQHILENAMVLYEALMKETPGLDGVVTYRVAHSTLTLFFPGRYGNAYSIVRDGCGSATAPTVSQKTPATFARDLEKTAASRGFSLSEEALEFFSRYASQVESFLLSMLRSDAPEVYAEAVGKGDSEVGEDVLDVLQSDARKFVLRKKSFSPKTVSNMLLGLAERLEAFGFSKPLSGGACAAGARVLGFSGREAPLAEGWFLDRRLLSPRGALVMSGLMEDALSPNASEKSRLRLLQQRPPVL